MGFRIKGTEKTSSTNFKCRSTTFFREEYATTPFLNRIPYFGGVFGKLTIDLGKLSIYFISNPQ